MFAPPPWIGMESYQIAQIKPFFKNGLKTHPKGVKAQNVSFRHLGEISQFFV